MTRISVIIPTYNRRDYLMECLASVAAQTVAPHEVIVVDDGSTDGTCEAVAAIPGVKLIRQANAGPGAARNRGAAEATGDYLAFLDSDDLWFPWSLASMAILIETHKPSLLFGRFVDFSYTTRLRAKIAEPKGQFYSDYLAASAAKVFAGAGMMVVDRRAFVSINGFVEDRFNAEDHDLALRLGTSAGFVQVTCPLTVAHRTHGENEMGDTGRSILGLLRVIRHERKGDYPGGQSRQPERRAIIATHARPAILAALRERKFKAAISLYKATFGWNLQAGRFRFLLVVPVVALRSLLSHPVAASKFP